MPIAKAFCASFIDIYIYIYILGAFIRHMPLQNSDGHGEAFLVACPLGVPSLYYCTHFIFTRCSDELDCIRGSTAVSSGLVMTRLFMEHVLGCPIIIIIIMQTNTVHCRGAFPNVLGSTSSCSGIARDSVV